MSRIRTVAAQITYAVVYKKINLAKSFKQRLKVNHPAEVKSAVKSLCYETIRHYLLLENAWLQCLEKKPKDKMVCVIMTQALAELTFQHKPAHVVVNEATNTAKKLNKAWASGLINATLRKAVIDGDIKPNNEVAKYSHPQWLIDQLKVDWQNHWQQILIANNQKPPLWVRAKTISTFTHSHNEIKNAHIIEPQNITLNKDFLAGNISVQDASAQLAAHILNPQDNDNILDLCAAPGGKTCHLLELNNNIKLDALEIYPNRAKKIHENLHRLSLHAKVIVADATQKQEWFQGEKYQKILLDAPCSASGIIRRQPDIKFLRQTNDLLNICKDQQKLLHVAAEVLAMKGMLLYATCSVFRRENSEQIKKFLKTHPDFYEITLKYPFAVNCEYGIQILPGTENMDGFYYCLLQKRALIKDVNNKDLRITSS